MAGGKLSPRQKMINMMYLVLTALLALNVSAEILQAFESLRTSMKNSASSQGQANQQLAAHILENIKKKEESKNSKYTYVREVVNDILGETEATIKYLDGLSDQLAVLGQRDEATGEIIKKDEVDANYRFWMGEDDHASGGRGNGEAQKLHDKLNGFVKWANEFYAKYDSTSEGNRFNPIVVEPKNDPTISNAESKSKTWEYHTFHGKPVIADMAMVEKMKMDVREVQTGLLNMAKTLVEATIFTVDSLIAFEAPSAQVVAAGMKYSVVLGVGVASKNIKPEFVGNGIQMNPGGSTATMTVNASGAVIPKGQYEGIQHYSAMIKVPMSNGDIEEIPVKGQFRVRKPEVIVRSEAMQLLYKDCGNPIVVDVPALADSYNPDFSASTGGRVVKSANSPNKITIVPTQNKFILDVSSRTNGQLINIEKLTFTVIPPPKPSIELSQPSSKITPTTPVNRKEKLTVKVKPDMDFMKTLPGEAKYKADAVRILLKQGLQPARSVREASGANIQNGVTIDLNVAEIKNAVQGDKIYIEIVNLRRVNSEGKAIEIPGLTVYDVTIPALLK